MTKHILFIFFLIGLTIECQEDPSVRKEKIERYIKKISEEFEAKQSIINRRKLSDSIDYINPTSILNIGIDWMTQEFSVKIKAKSDISNIELQSINYKNTTILSYKMEIKHENGVSVPLDPNVHYCTVNTHNDILINTNLTNGDVLSLWLKMKYATRYEEDDFLDLSVLIFVPYIFKETHCKYIFNSEPNIINIGLDLNSFSYLNSTAFIYDKDCPSSLVFDLIRITPYQVTWNVDMEASMYITEAPEMAYLFMPKLNYISGGTNFNFTQNDFSMSTINKGDDFNSFEEFYLFWMKNFTESERFIKLNLTFSSSPSFWNVTTHKIENTSTPESIALAKQILSEDNSTNPEYYKIGKWVSKNMRYNISLKGESLNISTLINIKQGVCHHYTELYNSLLNSIGIEAVYASGYILNGKTNPTDSDRHAWTVAKIGDKWLGLDATWNIFNKEGYLPQCHLFSSFSGSHAISTYSEGGIVNLIKREDIKLVEIVNFECEKPYLNINRNCKLCKEIDNTLPYYDFNTGECVNKCSQVIYNSVCYNNCGQIEGENTYVKNENNECEIKNVTNDNTHIKNEDETKTENDNSTYISNEDEMKDLDNETNKTNIDSKTKEKNSYSSIKINIVLMSLYLFLFI